METVTEEHRMARHGTIIVDSANSWAIEGIRPTERTLPIPLTEAELETIRVSSQRNNPPTVTAHEWDTATLMDLGKLREAYRRLESLLKIEKQYSIEASAGLNVMAQKETRLLEQVAQLQTESKELKRSLAESKLKLEELKLGCEEMRASLQARNLEIKTFNVHETLERAELEKKHFEDTELLRQKLSEALRQQAADAERWSKERDMYQVDIRTLKDRLDRFHSTEVTLCRLVSLCAHVQEAIQQLLISGRLFDATYRSLRRQQSAIAEEHAEQLRRAVALHLKGFDAEAQEIYEGLFGDDPEDLDVLYSYTRFLAFGLGDTQSALRLLQASQDARAARPPRQTARTLSESLVKQFQAELARTRAALLGLHEHVQQACAAALDAAGLGVSGTLLAAAAAEVPSARGWALRSESFE